MPGDHHPQVRGGVLKVAFSHVPPKLGHVDAQFIELSSNKSIHSAGTG